MQAAMEFEPLPNRSVLTASQNMIRPKLNRPDLQLQTSLVSGSALVVEPLWTLLLSGRRLATMVEMPATTPPELSATLQSEPLRTLTLTERNLKGYDFSRAIDILETDSALAAEGMQLIEKTSHQGLKPTNALANQVARLKSRPFKTAQPPAPSSLSATCIAQPTTSNGSTDASNPGGTVAQAETQSMQPLPGPILAASRENSPVSPAMTTTLSAQELQALPVSGRHWQDFVLDSAPTSTTPAAGQGQISLQGASQQPAEIAVDGVSRQLAFGSTTKQTSRGKAPPGKGRWGKVETNRQEWRR